MRGLIGLCIATTLVLGAVGAADASGADEETCDSCRCVLALRERMVQCCVAVIPDTAPGADGAPEPSDVSACWQQGQFDPDACTLLCEQFNKPGIPPANCGPLPCGPNEVLKVAVVKDVFGVGVGEEGPCDDCPTTEAGQCSDGVNNDAWLDDLTDTQDPDCKAATPAASPFGIAALLIALAGFGAYRLRRSRADRPS